MSPKIVLKRIRTFFLILILFFQLILASAVWADEVEKVPQKETSFWDVVLFPLNVVKVPVYALKYSTKPVITYIDKHPVLLFWLSGTLEEHYRRAIYPTMTVSGIEGIKGELVFFDKDFLLTQKKLKLKLSYSTLDYQNYQVSWGDIQLVPTTLYYNFISRSSQSSRKPFYGLGAETKETEKTWSLYYNFILRYSKSPREPFYGLGAETKETEKTSYNWEKAWVGAAVGKKLSSNLDLLAELIFTYNNIFKGRDPGVFSTGDVFDPSELPGLSTKIKLLTAKLTFLRDGRNSPGNPAKVGWKSFHLTSQKGLTTSYFVLDRWI